ncbi:MAG: arylesterase, partial [Gammaproteobacteria bacterium]|nr:arylesterase [Gammaproteobacteria bacterium]
MTVVLPNSYRIIVGLLLALILCNTSYGSTIRLVAIGDSLIAGYGLPVEDGFVIQLENALKARSFDVEIFNAGVSGDTTSGGLARIDWVLTDDYAGVILHLGHNDAFRGISVEQVRGNMDELIANIKQRGLPIVMSGAMAPRNLGPDYY